MSFSRVFFISSLAVAWLFSLSLFFSFSLCFLLLWIPSYDLMSACKIYMWKLNLERIKKLELLDTHTHTHKEATTTPHRAVKNTVQRHTILDLSGRALLYICVREWLTERLRRQLPEKNTSNHNNNNNNRKHKLRAFLYS